MKYRKFREWMKLKEVSTSTGEIAGFARITIGATNFRMYPEPLVMAISTSDHKDDHPKHKRGDDDKPKKKKKKRKHKDD